jgi:histidine ammonia-lyase
VAGGELLDPGDLDVNPSRVPPQDPYFIRCAPQVLGSIADTLALARDDKAVSGGNFHGEPIALGMDFLAIAMTEIASLAERRMFVLNDLRRGQADSVDTIPGSGNQEDHVSMSLDAALHARRITQNVEQVLAMKLICAAQAIWLQRSRPGAGELKLGRGVAAAYSASREAGVEPLTRIARLTPAAKGRIRIRRPRVPPPSGRPGPGADPRPG